MSEARVLIWDIETRGLEADYGSILCIGWMWNDEGKVHVKSVHDIPGKHFLDDKPLIKWFIENVWSEADHEVGWYNSGHDAPFLRTRALLHGMLPIREVQPVDLWGKIFKRFKFSRNSLDNVAKHLQLDVQKYWNPPADFTKCLVGDKAAMRRIVKHCKHDVLMTKKLYDILGPWARSMPRKRFAINATCRNCGSEKLQRRGIAYTVHKRPQQRLMCKDCGHWMQVSTREAFEEVKS
jgi:uncharacterized protein YprB with RNaseH-like and TPR domain